MSVLEENKAASILRFEGHTLTAHEAALSLLSFLHLDRYALTRCCTPDAANIVTDRGGGGGGHTPTSTSARNPPD